MDIPLFGDAPNKRRREINLGGSHVAATSQADILQQARLRRLHRDEQKRRELAATTIQSSWRAYITRRSAQHSLCSILDDDVSTLNALRALVLLGQNQDALARWSTAVLAPPLRQAYFLHDDPSWLVLFQRISRTLLLSVASNLSSKYAQSHLDVLNILLSTNPHRIQFARYLLSHRFYAILRDIILQLPTPAKPSPILQPLVTLFAQPFTTDDVLRSLSLPEMVSNILTIPLLPNRLLPVLITFTKHLPLSSFHALSLDIIHHSAFTSSQSKVHTLANLAAFTPPQYSAIPPSALATYLRFIASLMNALPTHSLEPPQDTPTAVKNWADDATDDESDIQVTIVTSLKPEQKLPQVDDRTRKRLQTFISSDHTYAILRSAQDRTLIAPVISFCFALATVWPSRRDKVLSSIVAYDRGALVVTLFREYVRSSPLGRSDSYDELTSAYPRISGPLARELMLGELEAEHTMHWPPLLLLADLYTQALLTMDDDEFFSRGTSPNVLRNPLNLDELIVFSRRLLNIAFALYWRADPANLQLSVPGLGQITWDSVREKATKCLQALHARDSRRSYTPPSHWLVTSHLDTNLFIEAAIHAEKDLTQPETGRQIPMSKAQIARFSPSLGVLNNIPFGIPFDVRVGIFRHFVVNDMQSRGFGAWRGRMGSTHVAIRRTHVAQDGFDKLGEIDLKSPISVTFIDQFGQEEAGIDGGGVFKEFLTSLCKEVFDGDRGLWLANTKNELYPAPTSYAMESHNLAWYRFIGRVLGKALYEGILVDVAFAGFFLAKWLEKQSWLDDLASLDPQLYDGLIFLKRYTGNPEELSLNFAVAEEDFGATRNIDLIPNGSNIPVTRENRLQYIYMVAHHRLTKQIKRQSNAFFEGLSEIIDAKWLRMFNQQELQILLGGVDTPIDLDDLRANTQYGGLYDDHEFTIQLFWQVVNSFSQENRRKLLRFATSCSRPPLLGFKELRPKFAIRDSSDDENRLPTASTCVNLLKLPRYRNARVLREKLLQALNSNAGFDLS